MASQVAALTLDGTDMTATITSNQVWFAPHSNLLIQLVFTGSPNGTFKLQASADAPDASDPVNTTVTNWSDVGDSSQAITEAGDHMYELQNISYSFVRLVWTDTSSGVSTLTSARYIAKGA